MTTTEFKALKPGDIVWYSTGGFTASKVKILKTQGAGATSRAWIKVLDRAPSQKDTEKVNLKAGGPGICVSYLKLEGLA